MRKELISRYQLILLLIWLTMGTGVLVIPSVITEFTVTDAWMAVPSLFVGGLLSAGIARVHVKKFPNSRATGGFLAMAGPVIGGVFIIWYISVVFLVGTVVAREFTLFVTVASLPYTSETAVAVIGCASVVYIAYVGIESFARANEFVVPLAVVVLPLLILLPLTLCDVHQFYPVFSSGWLPVWKASIVSIFVYGLEFSLAIQFVPNLRSPEKLPIDIVIAASISTVLILIVVILTVGVFGYTVRYLQYPVLELIRVVRIGRFIERLDTIYGIAVLMTIISKLTVIHLAMCTGIQDLCKTRDYRWAVLPTGTAMFVGGLYFYRNVAQMAYFIEHVGPSYLLFTVVGVPLLGLTLQRVRFHLKRRARKGG
ncbi:GerAB/ArcD/ProY family transporter [Alicyclobacillus mali (ex Roth et al. 2021)]|uniref:GerAB/ArcD/ProY family transporter n=1 Tax=Alicyclobacillus mali (ex Roth et al. 2021) TaxID=1123961 RepID=UPI0009E663CE|nr:GerAB/ArcD/ProY family transporter [Alicyclobacillus mali (ex Roth et al. 2021)]